MTDWLQYKDFNDFCKKTNMTHDEGREFLLRDCKKKGFL